MSQVELDPKNTYIGQFVESESAGDFSLRQQSLYVGRPDRADSGWALFYQGRILAETGCGCGGDDLDLQVARQMMADIRAMLQSKEGSHGIPQDQD